MARKDNNSADQEKESLSSGVSKKFKQNPALYIGSVAVLVLVVVTFVGGDLLSGGRFGGGGGDLTFGYYDKAPISWVPGNMFSQYYERFLQYYRSQYGDTGDFRFESQVWRDAFEFTAVHTAVIQIMKNSKYSVPDKAVDRNVAQLPRFQDNGRFSPALYRQMPESNRNNLWRQIKDEMTRSVFFDDTFNTLILSSEADFIANMAATSRMFDVVLFKVDDYPAEEYISFANENAELFKSIHLSRISINSEKEAARILDSIKDGTLLFEDAARSQSQDIYADRGGDMGSRLFYELDRDIPGISDRQAIFNLEKGGYSDIINNNGEWSFYRVEDELTEVNFDDETVMEKVKSYVRNYRRGLMEDWAFAQAQVFVEDAKESSFDNAARSRSIEKQSFGPLPINYGGLNLFTTLDSFTITGIPPADIGNISRNENFWKTAFSTELNTPSEPLVQGNNVLVFLPTEQSEVQDENIANIASMYSSYWVNNTTEQSLNPYFLKHEKMKDNFWDVYYRVFTP